MQKSTTIAVTLCAVLQAGALFADEVRTYQDENGTTWRETRRMTRQPVTRTEWQDRQQTVYRQELRADTYSTWRPVCTPVTEHRWLSRLHGRSEH